MQDNNNKEVIKIIKIENWQSRFKACAGSDRLLNKLSLINKQFPGNIDLTKIKKAIYYAKKYHGPQKRLTGELYYLHPLIVAEMVAEYCFKTDILVTAILHDTLCKALHNVSYAKKVIMQSNALNLH